MNQNDRRILRREAALEIESGRTLSQVAQKYGRTVKWVREACLENGIEISKKGGKKIIEIVKKKIEGKAVAEIAKEVHVSRQYVYSILNKTAFPPG